MRSSDLYVEARSLVQVITALEALDSIDFELHTAERHIRAELIRQYKERLQEIFRDVGADEANDILMPSYEVVPLDLNVN